jgi:type VI protein secretion system component VasF
MERAVGVILGVVVLVMCLGLVALMMWSEWSQAPQAQPLAEAPAPLAKKSSRKAAPKKKKAPAKKKKK